MKEREKKTVYPVRDVDRQLHMACRELNIGNIQTALVAGANVNAPDETHEYSPLDVVLNSFDGWDNYRSNPNLQRQIRMIVEILLSHGANPNGLRADERPLTVFAWSCCDPEACAMLLQYGAKVNGVCDDENTILDLVEEEIMFLSMTDGKDEVKQKLEMIWDMLKKRGAKNYCDLPPDEKTR